MYRKIFNLFFLSIIIFTLSSCEEVIVLDLDTSEQQIVIEANVNIKDKTCIVSMSKSADFYAENIFEKITGASISLSTSAGNIYFLDGLGDGQYSTSNIMTAPDEVLTLEINTADNQSFFVSAIVPQVVNLDTLLIEENTLGGFGGGSDDNYALTVEWQDTPNQINFYRVKIFQNEAYQSGVYVLVDDLLGDGTTFSRPIIGENYALGDELRVELLSVNKGYFDYFSDIANGESRGLNTPVPFNPSGNIDPDILGYFGIWQVSEKTVIVE